MKRFRNQGNIARFADEETTPTTQGEYNRQLFDLTIENIRKAVDAEVLSPEDGQEAELNAIEEYKSLIAEELGYVVEDSESDDEEDHEEYSDGSDLANFQAGNGFSAGLVQLLNVAGYDNLHDGVADLAKALGLDEEDTAGLFTGDFVPHPQLVSQIADVFDLDNDVYAELDDLGEEARLEAGYGEEEVEDNDALEEAVEQTAAYSRLENQLAEFQAESVLKDELAELERDCNRGFEEGWLPPVVYREMMGNFESEGDRLAAFSTLCNESGVNASVQLYAFRSILEQFSRCGPLLTFSSVVNEPLDPREAEQKHASSSQAELNFKLRKQRSGR